MAITPLDEERKAITSDLPIYRTMAPAGMPAVTGIGGPAITTDQIYRTTAAPAIGSGPAIPTVGPAPTGKPIGPAPDITRPNLTGPAITVPTTAAPVMRNGVTAPTMPAQQQQAISGDVFNRILPSIKQYEATTGRAISGKALKAFSEQEFETAANRAAQNKSLALQEYGLGLQKYSTDVSAETAANSQALQKYGIDVGAEQNTQQMLLQKYGIDTNADLQTQQLQLQKYGVETTAQLQQQDQDLKRFGMDTANLFQGAQMALQKYGMDADIAIRQYAQELQERGMQMDEAYRYADMALRKELGYTGIDAQKDMADQMAQSAAMGQLIGLGGMLGANYMTNQAITDAAKITAGTGTTAAGVGGPALTGVTGAGAAGTTGAAVGALPAAGTGALGTGAVGSGTLGTAHAGTGATAAAMDAGAVASGAGAIGPTTAAGAAAVTAGAFAAFDPNIIFGYSDKPVSIYNQMAGTLTKSPSAFMGNLEKFSPDKYSELKAAMKANDIDKSISLMKDLQPSKMVGPRIGSGMPSTGDPDEQWKIFMDMMMRAKAGDQTVQLVIGNPSYR